MTTDKYALGYSEEWLELMERRSASLEAGHVVNFVKPDSRILDVGCGPGSITIDLAELVSDGHVTGLDISDGQFERARALAKERGLENVTFQMGDAYELPFEDESFDIVCSNTLLMHLSDPARGIAEMKRVLKPGGYICARDPHFSARDIYGSTPCPVEDGVHKTNLAFLRVNEQDGSDWDAGIKLRGRLKAAGFLNVESGQSSNVNGNDDAWDVVRKTPAILRERLTRDLWMRSVELGVMTSEEVKAMYDWVLGLNNDPAAWSVMPFIWATGRKPG